MDERDAAVDRLAEQLYLKTRRADDGSGFRPWADLAPERTAHFRDVINHLLTFTDDFRVASHA